MKSKLLYKYFGAVASIITVATVLLIVLSSYFVGKYWASEKFKMLGSNAKALVAVANEIIGSTDFTAEISRTGAAVAETSDTTVFFVDTNGNTFTCSDSRKREDCIHWQKTIDESILYKVLNDGNYSETGTLGGIYSEAYYTVAMPISGWYKDLYGAVFISCKADAQHRYTMDIAKIFAFCGCAILVLAFIIVYIITNRLVRPVVEISAAAKAMSQGDYTRRVTVDRDDELGTLERSFNEMSAAVQSLEIMRSSFIANVSHELKTPMTTIGGFIDGILDGTIPPERTKKYLSIVSDEVKRLSLMVNAMLSLSKLESGQTEMIYSKVDITEIVCRIIISFSLQIENKGISITGMEDTPDIDVCGDHDLLYQAIYNLFDNAMKFTPDNGIININVKQDGSNAIICIENSGEGIRPEDIPLVFDRFYKADKSRSKDKTGFGLGLYIVKSIVEIHNGSVNVESEYGKSTTFSITLPNNRAT